MKHNQAFTLIELLVGVLIIGILAAIAVPQYQKATLKSRFSTLLPPAKSLWESNEIYYLNNGNYAQTLAELDISSPTDPHLQATLHNEERHQYVQTSNTSLPNRLTMYQKNSPNFAGETHCEALEENTLANWLCKDSLQGTPVGNKFGYTIYSLSPETVGSLGRNYYNQNGKTWQGEDYCVGTVRFGCEHSTVTPGSKCIADGREACNNSTFESGTTCEGNGYQACRHSSFTNASCEAGSDGQGCIHGTFQNHSTCQETSSPGGGCAYSTFEESTCEARRGCYGSDFTKNSSCIASGYRSCQESTFNNSSCLGNTNGDTQCVASTFTNQSTCTGLGNYDCSYSQFTDSSCVTGSASTYGCRNSTFTNSSCQGNNQWACLNGTFNIGSVCYANVKGSCTGTYNGGCCEGGDNCPANAPRCPVATSAE